jgi:hypothetical protein
MRLSEIKQRVRARAAAARKMKAEEPRKVDAIAYRAFNHGRNIGDSINPWLIERLFKRPVVFSSREADHVLPIGSIFFSASPHSHIWGSGILNPLHALPPFEPNNVHAVRGKLTLARLRELGHAVRDVPLGDPGYLVSEVVPQAWAKRRSRYRAAILPHYQSWGHDAFAGMGDRDDVALIDVRTDDPALLATICESDIVISESLHGLIFGTALGKPTTWISRRHDDAWYFKFHDWYSNSSNPPHEPLDLGAGLDRWIQAAEMRDVTIDREALTAAFPLNEVLQTVDGPLVSFDKCRRDTPLVVRADLFGNEVFRHPEGVALPELKSRVIGLATAATRARSYPTYVAIDPSGTVPQDVLELACTALDSMGILSFASIVPSTSGRDAAGRLDKDKRLLGGALVVRPSRVFDPASNFGTLTY